MVVRRKQVTPRATDFVQAHCKESIWLYDINTTRHIEVHENTVAKVKILERLIDKIQTNPDVTR